MNTRPVQPSLLDPHEIAPPPKDEMFERAWANFPYKERPTEDCGEAYRQFERDYYTSSGVLDHFAAIYNLPVEPVAKLIAALFTYAPPTTLERKIRDRWEAYAKEKAKYEAALSR